MEKLKSSVVKVMNWAVRRYIDRNGIKVIAVAGSIGKTSTTNAIRTVLSRQFKVHIPKTTYNTNRSVHLELFDLPFATSTAGWAGLVARVLLKSAGKAPYEVLVIEIGTDHPGELQSFVWLKPDIGVLTAIAPEHMEHFKTIEAVAEEELSIADFCKELVFNANTVDRAHAPSALSERAIWYGSGSAYEATKYRMEQNRVLADFSVAGEMLESVELRVLGEHSLDALAAAAAVASRCGMKAEDIGHGLQAIAPVKGRMQRLDGVKNTIIIDDSYNASPQACKAALDVLASFVTTQRIAVLGMMNEMGDYSAQAHREVGEYCDPARLDLVVTIGSEANHYLAGAAAAKGCAVKPFDSPYDAGAFVRAQLKPGAVILFKGSQNGVFAEEAIKSVIADPADTVKLTRQSAYWMQQKRLQFGSPPVL